VTIGTQRVPFEGPKDYNILFVGDSPGAEEVGQGRPFIGKDGALLERYLERNLVTRTQVKLAYLSKYRPSSYNKPGESAHFLPLLGSSQLEEGLNELEEEIRRIRPNIIVALGDWPLFYLTGCCGLDKTKPKPGSGILLYRGSRLPAVSRFGGEDQKVFVSLHPAYITRVWGWNPVFNLDITRAVEDSKYPELRYPEYEEHIDPDPSTLHDLVHESLAADWISLDIETFPNRKYSCVGWAYKHEGVDKGVCITYERPDLARFADEVWRSDTPKILQFGTYDSTFMQRFYQWELGGYHDGLGWDTYVASASLLPDFPRGLDFLVSIHTRFPYYKSDRKVWKQERDMNILWKYNIKDTVGTMHVALEQMEQMKELFG